MSLEVGFGACTSDDLRAHLERVGDTYGVRLLDMIVEAPEGGPLRTGLAAALQIHLYALMAEQTPCRLCRAGAEATADRLAHMIAADIDACGQALAITLKSVPAHLHGSHDDPADGGGLTH